MPEFDLNTSMSVLVLLGAITPFVTAVLTKMRDPEWKKGLVSMILVAATGIWAEAQSGDVFSTVEAVQAGAVAWLIHLGTYFGITSEMVARLHKATAGFSATFSFDKILNK